MPSSHSISSSFLILAETLWINFGTCYWGPDLQLETRAWTWVMVMEETELIVLG